MGGGSKSTSGHDHARRRGGRRTGSRPRRAHSNNSEQVDNQAPSSSECQLFLLPDAPPRKANKRKASPERVPCPLVPGTPPVPPPRKAQPWEAHLKDTSTAEVNAAVDVTSCWQVPDSTTPTVNQQEVISQTPPPVMKAEPPSPSSDSHALPTGTYMEADVKFEFIGFSPTANNQGVDFDTEVCVWEERVSNFGSDIESDGDDEDITNTTETGGEEEERTDLSDLPDDVVSLLSEMDAQDDSSLRKIASSDMYKFNWSSDPATLTGQREEFTGQAGPTFDVQNMSVFDVFQKIWDDDIITLIVKETNRYGQQINLATGKTMWTDIDKRDIWTFFAILMLQSIVPVPVEREYWYPCLPFLKIGDFNKIMPFKKFLAIKRCIHFVDNSKLTVSTRDTMKLAKIQPILDHLNMKFSTLYLPEQNIVIDESLLGWQGRLSFAHMIKTKAAQVGIKSYELCESRTGYLWKTIVYTGKGDNKPDSQVTNSDEPQDSTSKIVYKLVNPLLHRGHTLVMDNFYNSPLLSRTLKAKRTDTMGTVRLNRQFVPDCLRGKTKNNMRVGEIAACYTNDLALCVWCDTNVVSIISTYHRTEVGGKEKYDTYKNKPQVVLDYNLAMGGVDKKGQMLQAFPLERVRNQVWYKKLFRRLLNVSIHNSFVLYQTNTKMSQRQFRVQLVREIMDVMRHPAPEIPLAVVHATGHYPVKNVSGHGRCKWCAIKKKQSRTTFMCEGCGVNLCITSISCFKEYHVFLQTQNAVCRDTSL